MDLDGAGTTLHPSNIMNRTDMAPLLMAPLQYGRQHIKY